MEGHEVEQASGYPTDNDLCQSWSRSTKIDGACNWSDAGRTGGLFNFR